MKPQTHFFASALLLVSGVATAQSSSQASSTPTAESSFSLPPLPYASDSLSVAIDADTMAIHHGKHHRGYVDNLNKAVAAEPALPRPELPQNQPQSGQHHADRITLYGPLPPNG